MTMTPTRATLRSTSDAPEFTIRSALNAHGRTLEQTQYVTEVFVLTRTGDMSILFAPDLGGSFIVSTDRRELRHVDPQRQKPGPEQVRSLLGNLVIEEPNEVVDIEGRSCRLIRISNHDARLVLAIECYCFHVEGLGRTALAAERAFNEAVQPFTLPLRPDEIVARSTTRALAADFEQSQVLELTSLTDTIEFRDRLEEILDYHIVRS